MSPERLARRAMALTFAYDTLAGGLSMWFAVEFRGYLEPGPGRPFPEWTALWAAILFSLAAGAGLFTLQVHRQVWRHSGSPDALKVFQAAGLAALLFLPAMFLWNRLTGFPRSSLIIALALWLVLLFVGRMVALARSTRRPFQIFATVRRDAPKAILVGDIASIADALRGFQRAEGGAPIRVLALIATDKFEPGRAIRGVTLMGGIRDLGQVLDVLTARYGDVPWVGVAGQARRPEAMARVLEVASPRRAKIMALGTGDDGPRLTRVRPADLLARPERNLNIGPVDRLVRGAHILITGAGGTIGAELVRQCAELSPASLTLVDASEYNLYAIGVDLEEADTGVRVSRHLGDIRDERRMREILTKSRPDIILHAAALKHVPLMEENPVETVLTNIEGALIVARIAADVGVERFVQISTDKAVDPSNVMGATKRAAELALSYLCSRTGMSLAMVRFGNVLGSSGSVVPLFERQIARGGPVTVTDPNMTRYFMTVEEATALVLQAAALQSPEEGPSLFVLDMGSPVKIVQLAEAMIRLKGAVPGKDIEIEFTGTRPGEKLHEIVTYDHETLSATPVDGVMQVGSHIPARETFQRDLDALLTQAAQHNVAETLALLSRLVPEYKADGDAPAAGNVVRLRR